jgi:hypothetical protein
MRLEKVTGKMGSIGINLIPSWYHWDQLDAKLIVLDIYFPVRTLARLRHTIDVRAIRTECIFSLKLRRKSNLNLSQLLDFALPRNLDVSVNFWFSCIERCFGDPARARLWGPCLYKFARFKFNLIFRNIFLAASTPDRKTDFYLIGIL